MDWNNNIEVIQIRAENFTSNTYLIRHTSCNYVWLVDIGEFKKLMNYLKEDDIVKGVFITHPHYDHIFFINELMDKFSQCQIFASNKCIEGLRSAKLNLSYYHDHPVVYTGNRVEELKDGDQVEVFEAVFIDVFETPGHDWSCLSFQLNNYLFTGDSFIPNVKVVTKLRGGNKEVSQLSIKKIFSRINSETIICPGHEAMGSITEVNYTVLS